MSDVCALDGCDEPIEQQEGAPPRKYCCQAHRAAARSRRAVARRAAEPWEPAQLPELPEPGDPASGIPPESDEGDPLYLQIGAAVRQVVDDEGEPDEETLPVSGRPAPAREGTPAAPSRVPVALSRQPVPLESLRRRPRWATPRTALAAGIAAAMVLGGGSTLFAMNGQPVVAVPSPSPLPAAGAQWLDRANLALASTTEQLTQLDEAEKRWQQSTTRSRASNPPPAVTALEARRAFLESQRSILASQVAAWQNLQQSNAALATADQQLAALGAAADQPGQSADTQRQLDEQRATLSSRSQMLRDEAARWQQDVTIASSAPMPDTTPAPTTTVLAAVDGLRHGTPDPGRDEERGDGNTVLAERSPHSGDRERDLPGTGAPPRPDDGGAPASETASRPEHGGVVTALTRPVTGLLDGPRGGRGAGSHGGDGPADDGSGPAAPRDHGGGPVGRVAGTADDLVDHVDHVGSALTGRGRSEATPDQQGGPSTQADDSGSRERGSRRTLLAQSPGAAVPGLQAVHDVVGKAFDLRDQADQSDQAGGETSAPGVASTVMKVGDTVYRVTADGARSAAKTSAGSSTRTPSKGSSRTQTSDDRSTAAEHSGSAPQKATRSTASDHSSSDRATASEVRSAASALRAQSAFIREYAKTRSAQAVSTGDQARKDVAKAVRQAQARADEAVGKALTSVSSHRGSSSRTSSDSDRGGSSGHGSASRSTSKDSGAASSGSKNSGS